MENTINITGGGVSVDVERLKKIIVEEWKSGSLHRFYYDQGHRGEDLYKCILDDLGDYANTVLDEVSNATRKKMNLPKAYFDCRDNYPKSDMRSIGFEVLLLFAKVGWSTPIEELTTDDIPMILEFLDTPPGKSLEAWEKWEKYWASLDYPARRKKLLES